MRVVMVTTSYPLTPTSSSGIFIQRLIDHLPPDVSVRVITPCTTRPVIPQPHHITCTRYAPWSWQTLSHQPGGLPVAFKNKPWRLLLLPPFLLSLLWSITRAASQADLIHANWSIPGVLAGLAGLITGKPVLTTLRGSDIHRARDSRPHQWMLQLCLHLNQGIITVSAEFHTLITRWHPKQSHKIHLIPNGIDTDRFTPRTTPTTPQLITIANLIPHKGVHHLLTALASLRHTHPFHLLVVGDGPERTNLETQTRSLDLQNRVRFTGQVPPEQIPELLAQSTLFLSASAGEGRSNAILEAMASGLPIIAGRVSGMTELIDHETTGLLFDPNQPHTLTRAIATLLANPEQARHMGANGRQRLLTLGLDWSTTATRYRNLWSAILCAE